MEIAAAKLPGRRLGDCLGAGFHTHSSRLGSDERTLYALARIWAPFKSAGASLTDACRGKLVPKTELGNGHEHKIDVLNPTFPL
jgi:hypothetical protein